MTSDSDSVADAWRNHHYRNQTEAEATADALNLGQCDIDSGSTYFEAIVPAMQQGLLTNESVDRALFNSMRVRFEMGLFDPVSTVSARDGLELTRIRSHSSYSYSFSFYEMDAGIGAATIGETYARGSSRKCGHQGLKSKGCSAVVGSAAQRRQSQD